MHRAIAAWLTERPWRAAGAIAFCAVLAQLVISALAWVAFVALAFQGLAAAHNWLRPRRPASL